MNKNNTVKIMVLKILLTLLSSIFIGLGVSFLVYSQKGSDALLTVIDGLSKIFGLTTGNSNLLVNFTLFLFAIVVGSKYINLGTIIGTFTIGPCIDIWTNLLSPHLMPTELFHIDIIFCIVGILIISLGVAISIAIRFGFGPMDCIIFFIKNKTNISYKYIKIVFDITTICIGASLGGVIGVGTIISAIITGPSIEFFVKRVNSTILKPLKIDNDLNKFSKK